MRAKFNMAVVPRGIFVSIFLFNAQIVAISTAELTEFESISPEDIEHITKQSCLLFGLAFSANFDDKSLNVFKKLKVAFKREPNVRLALLKEDGDFSKTFKWNSEASRNLSSNSVLFFPRRKRDRTCLTPKPKFLPTAEIWKGNVDAQLLLLYLNSKCETFRTLDGDLSTQGRRRLEILENLYHLPKVSFPAMAAKCERIKLPSREMFLHEYLFRSRPVVIEGRGYFDFHTLGIDASLFGNFFINPLIGSSFYLTNKIFYHY